MNRSEIAVGLRLAYRKQRAPDHPVHEVVVTNAEVGSRQAEVRFVRRASAGPVLVRLDQLRCLWTDRERVLGDEFHRWDLKQDWVIRCNEVTETAIDIVATSASGSTGVHRSWTGTESTIGRLWRLAALEGSPLDTPLSFQDHDGIMHLDWSTSLTLARALCKANPAVILGLVEQHELIMKGGPSPEGELQEAFARSWASSLKLVRVWCDAGRAKSRLLLELQPLKERVEAIEDALRALEPASNTDHSQARPQGSARP